MIISLNDHFKIVSMSSWAFIIVTLLSIVVPNKSQFFRDEIISSDNGQQSIKYPIITENGRRYMKPKFVTDDESDFIRIKKNQHRVKLPSYNNEDGEEDKPLPNHRRKTFLNQQAEPSVCEPKKPKVEVNFIIDIKTSEAKGAKMLGVDFIDESRAKGNVNGLFEGCMEKCCETNGCDTALLSLKIGKVDKISNFY
jgi:hypothetical protein